MKSLNQIWADEMNGEVEPGTYRRAWNEIYGGKPMIKIEMVHEDEIKRLKESNYKMRACLRYAIDRLTDNDLDLAPRDLRHEWVLRATKVLEEGKKI